MNEFIDIFSIKHISNCVFGVLSVKNNETREWIKKILVTVIAGLIIATTGGAVSAYLSNRDQDLLIAQNSKLIDENKKTNDEQNKRVEEDYKYIRGRLDEITRAIK